MTCSHAFKHAEVASQLLRVDVFVDDEVAVEVDDVVIADPCAVALRVSSSTFRSRVSACALTRLNRALRSARVQILATVHDEAVLLVPDDVEL